MISLYYCDFSIYLVAVESSPGVAHSVSLSELAIKVIRPARSQEQTTQIDAKATHRRVLLQPGALRPKRTL